MKLVILVWDVTFIPYAIAWDVDITGILGVLAITSCTFWTCDIFKNFLTGVYKEGVLVTELRLVAKSYLGGFFLPDLAIVACDWLNLQSSGGQTNINILRMGKMGRLLRISKIFRIFRLWNTVQDFVQRVLTDWAQIAIQIAAIACGTLWVTHLLACVWFYIGQFG
eukprot:CAMPEP_0172906166 /NCGR_PEP_ID=MMETSP1075-20121228/176245_1 /TAXON_ID=2916 /ORGANISM="Ceratium fusus, Strain PA161109" /LENGTH=165 /DNA_ID=CAMNT_0013763537 /DNA_START=97 /DNA_END=591 /DNA_ORIENTATION=-